MGLAARLAQFSVALCLAQVAWEQYVRLLDEGFPREWPCDRHFRDEDGFGFHACAAGVAAFVESPALLWADFRALPAAPRWALGTALLLWLFSPLRALAAVLLDELGLGFLVDILLLSSAGGGAAGDEDEASVPELLEEADQPASTTAAPAPAPAAASSPRSAAARRPPKRPERLVFDPEQSPTFGLLPAGVAERWNASPSPSPSPSGRRRPLPPVRGTRAAPRDLKDEVD